MRNFVGLICLLVPMCGGCATLLRGTHQSLGVDTDPTGATVQVDGKSYLSPVQLDVRRKEAHDVVVSKDGYRTIEFSLDPQFDGLSLVGNMAIPGGSLGIVTDAWDGADSAFFELATIKMIPATQPSDTPLKLKDYKGQLLTDDEYASAVKADRADRSQFFRGEP